MQRLEQQKSRFLCSRTKIENCKQDYKQDRSAGAYFTITRRHSRNARVSQKKPINQNDATQYLL
jgi:hypothetical protein